MDFKKISPELSAAILNQPEKEKNKLLLRLIRKDSVLIEQLHFKLLEDEYDLESRKENALARVKGELRALESIETYHPYYYPKFQQSVMRYASGPINHYASITKDKVGELFLRVYLLKNFLGMEETRLQEETYDNQRLFVYLSNRVKNIFALYDKLHEDIQYDFNEDMNTMLTHAFNTELKNYLIKLGIPEEV